ncbi:MAG TPA: cytochrome D1 domain-containing protein [Nitrospirota bacterium]|nr:cytochrome D1 domain-containing protein [Nitrospirota bacterium]
MSFKKSALVVFVVLGVACLVFGVQAATGLKGTVYIAGHGGHLAIVDLATLNPPTDIEKDRIVLTEAGSEMEGKIAGMDFEQTKKGGGSHGSAIVGGKLYAGLLNGKVIVVDMKTRKKIETLDVGKKFCDAVVGPDGNIYFEDMADGNVYVWDPKGMKTVDKMPVGKAVCGIAWTKGLDKAYVSDMPLGVIYVLDWKTKKTIKEIKDPAMTFIHQIRMAPDQKHLWVTAPNEFGPGLSARTQKPQIVIIDTKTDAVSEHVVLPDDVNLHDVKFSPDGKTALITARTYGDDSLLVIMDAKTHKIEKRVSVCASCHKPNGITVGMDKGSPLLCGMAVDWQK